VFLTEHEDRSATKIESSDANILEQEFPSKSEVHRDSVLYEMDESAPSCLVE